METLLTILVLLLLSAASGWLKKRTEGSESEEPLPPPRPMGRPAPRPPSETPPAPGERRPVTRSWEEELRRLLEGEKPAAPPPPPLRPAEPMAPPAPPIILEPVVRERPKAQPLRPQPPRAPAPVLADLTATARRQAERLHERAAIEDKRAEVAAARQIAQTYATHRAGRTAEITAARGMLGSPEAARQAIIVSVVLGPPVGL